MRAARVANCILGGAAAALALFAARVVALLRALHAHGAGEPRLVAVAVAAVLLAAGCLLALRLRPARRVNLALAVAAVAVTLYAAELLLAWRVPGPPRMIDKLARIDALRAQGRAVSPGVEPVRFSWIRSPRMPTSVTLDGRPVLPLAGISRRYTIDCKEGGGDWMTFTTDEHGFHNPPGLWDAPSLELAFVGDSFVHGHCVPSGRNMVDHVRARHPATLSLGMAGSGPLAMLAELREYLPALRPRTVVWCYFSGNDLLDLRRERDHPLLRAYLEAGHSQGLAARQPALDRALDAYVETSLLPELRRRTRPFFEPGGLLGLRGLRSRAGLALADPYVLTPTEEELQLFARVLRAAQATVQGWGGRMVFVYLPAWPAPARQLGEQEYVKAKDAAAARVRALVKELGLPLADVEAAFQGAPRPDPLFACPGCHYSPEGYALAARVVLETIDGGGR
jgi:hypothetical protein